MTLQKGHRYRWQFKGLFLGDFGFVRDLLPYLWPKDAPALRRAVVYSLLCLIAAKVVTSLVPLTYKALVDHLDENAATIAVPVGIVLAYGSARLMAIVFEELRNAVFTRVSGNATRLLGLRVFRQLHQLSLRFHLDRKTGGLARAIERGTQGISVILSRVLFSIVPIALEVALVCTILWHLFGGSFSLVTLVTVVVYAGFTIVMTSWRTRFRRFLNDASAEASSRSIDSLLNYETVKYFGNEEHEAQRLDYALCSSGCFDCRKDLTVRFAGRYERGPLAACPPPGSRTRAGTTPEAGGPA